MLDSHTGVLMSNLPQNGQGNPLDLGTDPNILAQTFGADPRHHMQGNLHR